MRTHKSLFLILSLVLLAGCYSAGRRQNASIVSTNEQAIKDRAPRAPQEEVEKPLLNNFLDQASQSQQVVEANDRKIIRNADLTLEVAAPAEVQRKISSIAESLEGFVVTSESKQRESGEPGKQYLEVNLVIRVPAAQFGAALDQIRNAGTRVIQEKITGQDVTEEFIDLEARIKTQKALELQFLEIMKQATKVSDALEVQRQIAEVRTEIEKLEGRKRFLENRASLSTITVNLQSPNAIAVNTSGFGRSVREAIADGVDVAVAIVLFLIRLVIVMIPILILVILPSWILARFVFRRARKMRFGGGSPKNASPSDSTPDSPPA